MASVKINFSTPEAAEHFAVWLCESGEQDYWTWMEARESEEPDKQITATDFKYPTFSSGKKKPAETIEIGTKLKKSLNERLKEE